MYFNELSYDSFWPPKFFPATISGVNKEPNPFNGMTPPTNFGSKLLKLCLHDFSSILKVQAILRTTSAILNYVNLIILTYSLQAQNSTSTVNDDSDYSFLSRFFFSIFLENKPSHNLPYYHFGGYDLYNQTSQTFRVGWSTRGLDDQTYSIGESKLVRLIVYITIFPLGHKQYAKGAANESTCWPWDKTTHIK